MPRLEALGVAKEIDFVDLDLCLLEQAFDAAEAADGVEAVEQCVALMRAGIVEVCGPETRFQPTLQMLTELDPPVSGVIVAIPAIKTGTVLLPDLLAAIATWCRERSGSVA